MREWTVGQRIHAARELYAVLVLSEQTSEEFADQLIPAVCAAVGDDELSVASGIVSATHMIGNFVNPTVWVPLLLEHLHNEKQTPQQRSSTYAPVSFSFW